jgi:uncharacterized protein
MNGEPDRHLPQPALIDAYGNGGFRFAGMSHRGSLLCLPDGIWAWPVRLPEDVSEDTLTPVFARAESLDFVLIGAGRDLWVMPERLRQRFRTVSLSADAMTTGAAVRTYNVLLAENRRVAAGLIAVD